MAIERPLELRTCATQEKSMTAAHEAINSINALKNVSDDAGIG